MTSSSDDDRDAVTPSMRRRFVKSYTARWTYGGKARRPPHTDGVARTFDLHCHAHQGQQDPLALAQHASRSEMGGILFKTLDFNVPPMEKLAEIEGALNRWADTEKIAPIRCFAGAMTDVWTGGPSAKTILPHVTAGVRAVWLPTASHASSMSQVGGRRRWFDRKDGRAFPPMPFEEARSMGGLYLLDGGRLVEGAREVVAVCADHDLALFFGHLTHDEQDAVAEEIDRRRLRRGVVDHPFSPFVDLSVERMKSLARAGIYMNFTYDELSPMLGVDPFDMYTAIREVGCDRVTLSSDAGEALFPDSVECMRLMRTMMGAYGLNDAELDTVTITNPKFVLGLPSA